MKEKLEGLEKRISAVLSTLDGILEDYFEQDKEVLPAENVVEAIRLNLYNAWDEMDAARDEIKFLLTGEKPEIISEPVPPISAETFRAILRNITQETIQDANQAALFFLEQINGVTDKKEAPAINGVFMAALLIEYGKLTANKKELGRAADPEEKEVNQTGNQRTSKTE
ncbi:hypothetical protein SAMN04487864_1232 [Succiniclasticum ruminis]|uniref:Uncharacterized protein n=1 Tax=Succiniclasticum ruminis TaxID=40841 RepID=A0A1G6P8P9_9FIRM|nr:hypothetical protein [Succiniclasticum ruminis]SDC76378.1 hypothetical protein SAMN04487864_1232 [Succiniclasticum ruminis]